jgi:hypothetical protein
VYVPLETVPSSFSVPLVTKVPLSKPISASVHDHVICEKENNGNNVNKINFFIV